MSKWQLFGISPRQWALQWCWELNRDGRCSWWRGLIVDLVYRIDGRDDRQMRRTLRQIVGEYARDARQRAKGLQR